MNTRVIQGVSFIAVRSPQVSRDYPENARFPCNQAVVLGKTIRKHPYYISQKKKKRKDNEKEEKKKEKEEEEEKKKKEKEKEKKEKKKKEEEEKEKEKEKKEEEEEEEKKMKLTIQVIKVLIGLLLCLIKHNLIKTHQNRGANRRIPNTDVRYR